MISIHALREEGDRRSCSEPQYSLNFNPRPPRGGRRGASAAMRCTWEFQSTPSARRATLRQSTSRHLREEFQSTPSARRATRRLSTGD